MWVKRLLDKIDARLPSRRLGAEFRFEADRLVLVQNGQEQRFTPVQVLDVFAHRRELYMEDCVSLVVCLKGNIRVEVDEGMPGWRNLDNQLAQLMGRKVNAQWYFEALDAGPGRRVEVLG